MAIVNSVTLKSYFETGDVPTQNQFIDLVDTIFDGLSTRPKVYRALLSQSGSSAPTAFILANTLGGLPVLTRSGAGVYFITLNGAFTLSKTSIVTGSTFNQGTANFFNANTPQETITSNIVELYTYGEGVSTDDILSETYIESSFYL